MFIRNHFYFYESKYMARLFQSVFMISRLAAPVLGVFTYAIVSFAADGLTISLTTDRSIEDAKAIDIDAAFRVVLKNNTENEIKIWHPESQGGYYVLTLDSTNLETGETFVTKRRQIDDATYFDDLIDEMEPGAKLILIPPGTTFTVHVNMLEFAWSKLGWLGVPEPNTGARYTVKAKYQVLSNDDQTVWSGKIESDPVETRFVSARLDTPHEYLSHNMSSSALRMMKSDPSWIDRENQQSETPLHIAASKKQLDAAKWLLDNDADVNALAYIQSSKTHCVILKSYVYSSRMELI